ncbi:unnamed protein product [Acanthoscelides obtectus]|uniref:DUF4817 domain-containing protein n=1 Tax=Acanthoscelides obtectus TaxID=200917 RepID=A0A9P0KN96_ACAOB|nr:unnamed protein product [Acanthoscelides obtectus]CAK1682063.1 hypothetical protein AOBTE_LOCUS33406 [Acanthoscelides obtectus]
MNFSTQGMVDMIYVLGASDKNSLLAIRLYNQRHPDRREPCRKTLDSLMERFKCTASEAYEKKERVKPVSQFLTYMFMNENDIFE